MGRKKIKQTQGNKKLKRYIEDLCNNKNFLSLWKKVSYTSDKRMKKEGLIIMSEKYGINLEQYWMIDDRYWLRDARYGILATR